MLLINTFSWVCSSSVCVWILKGAVQPDIHTKQTTRLKMAFRFEEGLVCYTKEGCVCGGEQNIFASEVMRSPVGGHRSVKH